MDYDYLKYMRTAERGIQKPISVNRYKNRRGTEAPTLKSELNRLNEANSSVNTRFRMKSPLTLNNSLNKNSSIDKILVEDMTDMGTIISKREHSALQNSMKQGNIVETVSRNMHLLSDQPLLSKDASQVTLAPSLNPLSSLRGSPSGRTLKTNRTGVTT